MVITIAVLFLGIGIASTGLYYRGSISALRERIILASENIKWLENRLSLLPLKSVYSRLPNADLRAMTMSHVSRIRAYLERTDMEIRETPTHRARSLKEKMVEGNEIWRQWSDVVRELNLKHRSEYERTFHADTIILRDELSSRLSSTVTDRSIYNRYNEFDSESIGIVATDLERMAKILPNH